MGSHPLNLLVRFLLEISALVSIGAWAWRQNDSWYRIVFAVGLPIIFAALWGIFAVPNDPSRSGSTVVITSGVIRILIELGFFGFAIWTLYDMELSKELLVFCIMVSVHYLVSYDRIIWLLQQ
ncbi:MAG: YrdB family protein [Saprospiraceae bacterium]